MIVERWNILGHSVNLRVLTIAILRARKSTDRAGHSVQLRVNQVLVSRKSTDWAGPSAQLRANWFFAASQSTDSIARALHVDTMSWVCPFLIDTQYPLDRIYFCHLRLLVDISSSTFEPNQYRQCWETYVGYCISSTSNAVYKSGHFGLDKHSWMLKSNAKGN